MKRLFLAVVLASTACSRGAEPEISRSEVERIIETLASDEMEGRSAFGPTIERAADFIAGEFEAIGLEPVAGSEGYRQAFQVHGAQVAEATVTVDGTEVPDDHVAIALGAPAIDWDQSSGVSVIRIGADQDPGGLVQALQGGDDAVVLVHPVHAEAFERVRGFLSRPRFRTSPEGGASTVLVLGSDIGARVFSVAVSGSTLAPELANVVGKIEGRRPDEIVLFSAHYDHIGIRPAVNGDSIANGANDNASGTTALIELARYFAAMGVPERTLLFAAFTAEEGGGFGSRHFSSQLDPDQIVAMFNIEMIGKPAVSGPNTAWITGFDRSDFGAILQRSVEGTDYSFYADPYPEQNLFYRSDNATLARLGVPAHSISTTPIDVDTDYHQVSDHVETLDLDHLTNTIRAIAAGANTIVSGRETPTRVDPMTVEP
jgi:hypothetical protein